MVEANRISRSFLIQTWDSKKPLERKSLSRRGSLRQPLYAQHPALTSFFEIQMPLEAFPGSDSSEDDIS